jgi:uncharacterized protein YehS (DUF1456 family)
MCEIAGMVRFPWDMKFRECQGRYFLKKLAARVECRSRSWDRP